MEFSCNKKIKKQNAFAITIYNSACRIFQTQFNDVKMLNNLIVFYASKIRTPQKPKIG